MFSIIEFENVNYCNSSILPQNALRRDTHARIQNVLSEGGSKFVFFFFIFSIDEGREDPNATISGPSLARQRNAI